MADFQIGQTRKIYTHVNEQQFKELLQLSPTPNIIIKFSAPWCKPCKKLKMYAIVVLQNYPKV